MRENLSLESPRSRDNFLRQPQIGAYFTKNAPERQPPRRSQMSAVYNFCYD